MSGSSVLRMSPFHFILIPNALSKLISRCNNQVGKVEEGHINRNAVLRSTTTWPNERVSSPVHVMTKN
jgi:hypothetical protein